MHDSTLFYRSIYAALFIGASSMLFSCNDDIRPGDKNDSSDRVCFRLTEASWGNAADTRSTFPVSREIGRAVLRSTESSDTLCLTAIETAGINLGSSTRGSQISSKDALSSFGCFAYVGTTPGKYTQFYINNDEYTKNGEIYQSENIQYWPGSALNFKFYCYAPFNASGLGLPESPESTILQYEVPASVADQKDLMLAPTEEYPGNRNEQVPLSFKHLLSAVKVISGEKMQAGTVKSVSFTGLHGQATINMDAVDTEGWDYIGGIEGRKSFSSSDQITIAENESKKNLISTNESDAFIFLPQTLSDTENSIIIEFNDGEKDRTLTAPLTGLWEMGKTYTYIISITPEYELSFSQVPDKQDAHYVSCLTTINANNLPQGKNWILTASASDGADVTVQLETQVNEYAKEGYWVDKIMNNGVLSTESARGTNSIVSNENGEIEVRVFIPENNGTSNRTITLSLGIEGSTSSRAVQSIEQYCPDWKSDNTGWEQIDDNQSSPWGFDSHRVQVYVYNHAGLGLGIFDGILQYITGNMKTIIDNLITDYNASSYVSVGEYEYGLWIKNTFNYVSIDYSSLSNLGSNAASNTDGLTNTRHLYSMAGPVYSSIFENALSGLTRADGDKLLIKREESGYNIPNSVPQSVEDAGFSNGFLPYILKKNKGYINKITEGSGDQQVTTTVLAYNVDELVWYLPAYSQFDGVTSFGDNTLDPSSFWSSTGGTNSTDSYLGNGITDSRRNSHKIIVCRNKQ